MNSERKELLTPVNSLPYVTAKESKILGKIRQTPNDFQVQEIASYQPEGKGDHLFVYFRKTGLNTSEAVKRIANRLGVDPQCASWAGLKDRNAVTEQWASFLGGDPKQVSKLKFDQIEILDASLHPHKLRIGHLRGNQFRIRIRETNNDSAEVASQILTQLERYGMPNYYGVQRFGYGGQNINRAKDWILNSGKSPTSRRMRKFYLSVLQSAMFNEWLALRIQSVPIDRPIDGDLLCKEDTGGLFVNDDMNSAQLRMKSWQISATGPIYGTKMRWPERQARLLEEEVLNHWRIPFDTFRPFRQIGPGSRRKLRVRPHQWVAQMKSDTLEISFFLPKGAYATVLLRELMKSDIEENEGNGN